MEIKVIRNILANEYTVGKLYIDGIYICDTIEDRFRKIEKKEDKIYGVTAIPNGRYPVVLDYSPKYSKLMPHILDVPYFEGIRIHSGNSDEDSLGCIIVGEYCPGVAGGWVANSRIAYNKVFTKLQQASDKGERIFITISIDQK
jgi:hypothetical protein